MGSSGIGGRGGVAGVWTGFFVVAATVIKQFGQQVVVLSVDVEVTHALLLDLVDGEENLQKLLVEDRRAFVLGG